MQKILLLWLLLLSAWIPTSGAQEQRALKPVRAVEPAPVPSAEQRFRYRALLIGNNDYEHWPNLKTAINDVEQLSAVLQQTYGFAPEDVLLLKNATRRETLQAFRQLREATRPEDRLLVYYAGHGHADAATNRGFWVPVDAAEEYDYLPNEVIRKELEIIDAKHKLLIADSCFSGTFATQERSVAEQNFDWREQGYYVNLSSDPSFQALTSGGNEPVFDGGSSWGGHSIFAFHLLSKLRNNRDPYFPVRRLGTHLSEQVANDVASIFEERQQPNVWQIRPGHAGGEFFFLRQDALDRPVAFVPRQLPPQRGQGRNNRVLLVLLEPEDASLRETWTSVREEAFTPLREVLDATPFAIVQSGEMLGSRADLGPLMRQHQADSALVLSLTGRLEKQRDILWKGVAEATLELEIFQRKGPRPEHLATWQPDPQKLPSRQWKETPEFRAQLLSKTVRKVLQKADLQSLPALLQP